MLVGGFLFRFPQHSSHGDPNKRKQRQQKYNDDGDYCTDYTQSQRWTHVSLRARGKH